MMSLSIATSSQTPTQPPPQTQPPTTPPPSPPGGAGASAGAIAGGVIGGLIGVILIVLIIVVIVYLIWRTNNSPSKCNNSVHRMFSMITKQWRTPPAGTMLCSRNLHGTAGKPYVDQEIYVSQDRESPPIRPESASPCSVSAKNKVFQL